MKILGKPSVLFYEPAVSGVNEYSAFAEKLPLIGPIGMATMLRDKGYPVTAKNGNISLLTRADMRAADVLVLSALTPSAPSAYMAAMAYKKENPHGRVIIGGPHVTFLPEEALRFADQVGTGEGENIIEGMVLGDFKEPVVKGTPVENLDDIVLPDLGIVQGLDNSYAPFSTTRGCPHGCYFCSVAPMYGRKQRQVSVERAVELFRAALLRAKSGFNYDDNLPANRRWIMQVLEALVENKINLSFTFQARSTVGGDEELLEKLAAAHASTACIGYESLSAKKLKEYGKGEIMPLEESAAGFNRHNIAVQAMLIWDGKKRDGSECESVDAAVREFSSLPVQYLQMTILTPVPGSPLFEHVKKEGLFLRGLDPLADGDSWVNWRLFDGGHVVHRDPLSRGVEESYERLAEIQQMPYEVLANFYSPWRIFTHPKLKGGRDWKLLLFNRIASKARRKNRDYVKALKRIAEWEKKGSIFIDEGESPFGGRKGRVVQF